MSDQCPVTADAFNFSTSLLQQVWKRLDPQGTGDPPKPLQSEYRLRKILIAAMVQGAIFSVVRALINRGGARAFQRWTGEWPGDQKEPGRTAAFLDRGGSIGLPARNRGNDLGGTAMKAVWNGVVVAESDDTVVVEGNHYFPRDSVDETLVQPSDKHTVCGWKGQASYLTLHVDGQTNVDAAWFYPEPLPAAEAVKDRVAFWRGVQVSDGR